MRLSVTLCMVSDHSLMSTHSHPWWLSCSANSETQTLLNCEFFFLISMQQTRWPLLPWGIKNIGSVCSSDSHRSCTSKPVAHLTPTVAVPASLSGHSFLLSVCPRKNLNLFVSIYSHILTIAKYTKQ